MRHILFITSLLALVLTANANIITEDILFKESTFSVIVDEKGISPKTVMNWKGMDTYVTSEFVPIPYKVITIEVPLLSKSFKINEIVAHYSKTINCKFPLLQEKFESQSELFGMRLESSILKDLESKHVEIIDEYLTNNIHYLKIALTPIKCDIDKNEIYVYDHLRFNIEFEECMEDDMEYKIYNSHKNKKYVSHNGELKQYIIITTDAFKCICEDISLWKKELGYNSQVVTVNEILSNPDFTIGDKTGIVDAAEAIRQYLLSIYSQNEMYCLFVGDTSMPFRYFYESSNRESDFGDIHQDNFIPSDLYFSDLTKKWILHKEESDIYTVPLSQISYSPNIYVGRIICSTEDELNNYIKKLMIYESFPGRGDDEYLDTALVFQQTQHLDYPNIVEIIGKYKTLLKYQDNKSYKFESSFPTGQDIIEGLRRCGLSSWQGHGSPGIVACSGKNKDGKNWRYIKARNEYVGVSQWLSDMEKNNGLDLMDNENYPSIVYSLSCNIAPFDDCWEHQYNMGTSFTVGGSYGGAAFLGNTRTGWDYANKKIETCFANNVQFFTIGKSHANAKKASNVTDGYALAAHNIIGDPSLYIWIGKPKRFNPTFSQNGNVLSICDSNLLDASVIIFDGNRSDLYYSGSSNLNINNSFEDKIQLISIIKRDYLPEMLLFGQNFTLTDYSKKFICKNAYLGQNVITGKDIGNAVIGENCNLNIKSIDCVNLDEGVVIESNGRLNICCDGYIEINGICVKDNGTLNLTGQKVGFKNGTKICKGAVLKVNVK